MAVLGAGGRLSVVAGVSLHLALMHVLGLLSSDPAFVAMRGRSRCRAYRFFRGEAHLFLRARLTSFLFVVALLAGLAAPVAAEAATNGAATVGSVQGNTLPPPDLLSPRIFPPASQTIPPPTFAISARQAIAIADRTVQVRKARARHPTLHAKPYISPLELAAGRFYHWDVVYEAEGKQWVEVEMGRTGHIFEIQTYPDVGWTLLRGYTGVLGLKLNAPYVWLPLCVLFLLPFFDPRRPFRLLHFDLLAILGFGISQYFFTDGRPDISVPLVYPFLAYVAVRLACAGFRPVRRAGSLMPQASTRFLAGLVLCLIALRVVFTIVGSGTFDVSTAGVIGADRIEHGLQLYVFNDAYGDTYGPIAYLSYIPAELIFPVTTGVVDAARAAALTFDLLTILGLFLLGRSLRPGANGNRLGLALAFAWSACPYTGLILASTTNDALVPMFVIYALLALRSPPGRGLLAGIATMGKFAPGLLAPVLLVGRGPFRLRPVAIATAAFCAVCIGLVWVFLPQGGLSEFWKTTLGFQLHRTSPLSIWVRAPELTFLRPVAEAIAIGLAVTAAFVPRRRTVGQVAALCGAIIAAAQIPANYWIYFYVAWFAPFLFIGLFDEYADLGPSDQDKLTSSFVNPVSSSQPSSVTATRSSMRTPSLPGR